MNPAGFLSPRLRTLLDCCLVLLLILLITAQGQPVQAQTRLQPLAAGGLATGPLPAPQTAAAILGLPGESPSSGLTSLDNNTLAALIAAENAALTLPQYWINLPVITR